MNFWYCTRFLPNSTVFTCAFVFKEKKTALTRISLSSFFIRSVLFRLKIKIGNKNSTVAVIGECFFCEANCEAWPKQNLLKLVVYVVGKRAINLIWHFSFSF